MGMTGKGRMTGILILWLGFLVIFSGCTSPQQENSLNSTTTITVSVVPASPQPTVTKAWVQIDPIHNYTTDSSFNIIGPTALIVNGTTSLPAGTRVPVLIRGVDMDDRQEIADTEIRSNGTGPNFFSYRYDVKGLPPGRYRFQINSNRVLRRTAYRDFFITSEKSYYTWIRMDRPVYTRNQILFNGTTDLPAGSELMVDMYVELLGCGMEKEWNNGYVTKICKGECSDFRQIVPVAEGTGGTNVWNLTMNITVEGCQGQYIVNVQAKDWTNATELYQVV